MKITMRTNFPQWAEDTPKRAERLRIDHTLSFDLHVKGIEETKELLTSSTFWEGLLNAFMQVVIKELQNYYFARANGGPDSPYWPQIANKRPPVPDPVLSTQQEGDAVFEVSMPKRRPSEKPKTTPAPRRGFDDLWALISTTTPAKTVAGAVVEAGIGPFKQILGLTMKEYSPIGGGSKPSEGPNIWFYGVEFGTGVKENILDGNPRLVGDSKVTAEDQKEWKVGPGAWWVRPSPTSKNAALFTGQKGFGMLFDATGGPSKVVLDLFATTFPQFVKDYVRDNYDKHVIARLR